MLVIHLRWLMLGHTLPHCLSSVDWVNGPRWVALPHKRLLAEHCLFSAVGGANDFCGWVKATRFSCIVDPSEGGCVCAARIQVHPRSLGWRIGSTVTLFKR